MLADCWSKRPGTIGHDIVPGKFCETDGTEQPQLPELVAMPGTDASTTGGRHPLTGRNVP